MWIDRGAVRISSSAIWERVSGRAKGQTAEVSYAARAQDAGPPENILRTVTKVECYHSLRMQYAVNVGFAPRIHGIFVAKRMKGSIL